MSNNCFSGTNEKQVDLITEIHGILHVNPEAAVSLHKKMKSPMKDLFSKCYQIRKKLLIWSDLLKKSLIENFIS